MASDRRETMGGWISSRRGWLQIGVGPWVGGFRPTWVAETWVVVNRRSISEGVASDRHETMGGWLQTNVGGFSLAWAVCGRGVWVLIGARGLLWVEKDE